MGRMNTRSLILILIYLFPGGKANSAWNGQTTPESTTPTAFSPYYVPPGSKGYDSASPLVHYSGKWIETLSGAYVGKTLQWTSKENASASFTFTGTGIEWFGNTGKSHGVSDVLVDGILVESVDVWSDVNRKQQRIFWRFDLPYGKHTIKVINTGQRIGSTKTTILDIDAFVVTKGRPQAPNTSTLQNSSIPLLISDISERNAAPQWFMVQRGNTGVHAMQLSIISPTHALIVDKVEHNPITISGHPAWAALYNLETDAIKPLNMQSNSFCAGGTFLSNGTLINVGGNPVVAGHTSSADFGDADGLQAIRVFHPCIGGSVDDCDMYENHSRLRMASPRWYNTVLRISDGSAMVIGGSKKGGWINNATVNNPSIEYYPPKSIHGSNGLAIKLPFLEDTLSSNLFPIAFALPDGRVFMAANQDAMIYDWKSNTEQRLPKIPNGVRVTYPMTGTALLLPLSPENNYTPEVLICGGSSVDDSKAGYEISSQEPASAQCSRMVLNEAGIASGWEVEQMPQARIMPDAVLLPTGQILIVNGAGSGISGYGNVIGQVGQSNAANPVLTPVLYEPSAPVGQRFSQEGMPTSQIPRLYHSVATLTPKGHIMIAGSNPNLDRSEVEYGTEYRVEWLSPPYMSMSRPVLSLQEPSAKLRFGKTLDASLTLPATIQHNPDIKVALVDLGYITHAVHANSRMVYLDATLSSKSLVISGPPNGEVYPPGPGWLYVLVDGVPSEGILVMVGEGNSPPVDDSALANVLKNTDANQYEELKAQRTDGSE